MENCKKQLTSKSLLKPFAEKKSSNFEEMRKSFYLNKNKYQALIQQIPEYKYCYLWAVPGREVEALPHIQKQVCRYGRDHRELAQVDRAPEQSM